MGTPDFGTKSGLDPTTSVIPCRSRVSVMPGVTRLHMLVDSCLSRFRHSLGIYIYVFIYKT